ncbi:MAG: glycosyltransferase [Planctomycetota bacterium]
MDSIRVGGEPGTALDRTSVERARASTLRRDVGPQPICTAPFTVLVVDASGDVRPCEGTDEALVKRRPTDALRTFHGINAERLRATILSGELPGDHCRRCIDRLALDLPFQAPLIDRHGADALSGNDLRLQRLIVRLDRGARPADPKTFVRRVRTALSEARMLTVVCAEPESDELLDMLLAEVAAQADPPKLELATPAIRSVEQLRARFHGLELAALTFLGVADLETSLLASVQLLPAGVPPTVRLTIAPDNWFEIHEAARTCAARGVDLSLRNTDLDGHAPMRAAPLADQRFVLGVLGSLWYRFNGPDRPISLAPDEFERLRTEFRRQLDVEVQEREYRDPEELLAGQTAIELPPREHHLWAEERDRAVLLGWLAGLEASPAFARWVEQATDQRGFLKVFQDNPALRLTLARIACAAPEERALTALQKLYGEDVPPEIRATLLTEDDAEAQRAGIESAHAHWRGWLGFDRIGPRKAPFRVDMGEVGTETEASTADVTILIPSFRHESFVQDCVRSALAQTHRHVRVMVVDDRSPDDTVARVSALEDPRLEVSVNAGNRGLANSVLDALERVTTPFVALLNSDDLFHPERIERCLGVFADEPDAQVVTTGLHLIDERDGELTIENTNRLTDGKLVHDWVHWYESAQPDPAAAVDLFASLLEHNFLATSSNFVCRTDYLRSQASALRSLKYCLDWHVFLDAARRGVLRHLPERLAAYRMHRGNTVWFREGRRWRYYLEVNRVAAQALRDFARDDHEATRGAVQLVEGHVAHNTEVDGVAVWLNELLGGFELERDSELDPELQQAIESLCHRAERAVRLGYAAREIGEDRLERSLGALSRVARLEVARIGLALARDEARAGRDAERWARNAEAQTRARLTDVQRALQDLKRRERHTTEQLRRALRSATAAGLQLSEGLGGLEARENEDPIDRLERVVKVWVDAAERSAAENTRLQSALQQAQEDARNERERAARMEGEKSLLAAEREKAEKELATAQSRLVADRSRIAELRARVDEVRMDLQDSRKANEALREERRALERQITVLAERLRQTEEDRDQRIEELTAAHGARVSALEAERDRRAGELQSLRSEMDRIEAARRDLEGSVRRLRSTGARAAQTVGFHSSEPELPAEETERVAASLHRLRREVEAGRTDLEATRSEIERIHRSIEWRIGVMLWRKLPLFAKSRRALRATWRRSREATTRTMLFLKKLWGTRKSGPTPELKIAAGSTAQFPVISHTFVYQELTAMREMLGGDVKVFHTQDGDRSALHAAFQGLDDDREFIQPAWEVHTADMEYYRRTQPERFDALVEAIAQEADLSREDLEQRFEFRLAFTFARRHALWGADYVHSYFFYDQALCALVSSWMNGLPRGLSTYADHMMQDWPLKVTALHLRTADVIVATSRRIRDELIGIAGPEIADKVIVKPNGVDGSRFTFVARQPRAGRALELGCVTRIEPKKGMLELAEAARILVDQGVDVKIHIIGSADVGSASSEAYAEEFEDRIQALGVGDVVIRHGRMRQEEMRPLMATWDAFVAPFVETESGDKDGIPTAILEAIATGLPGGATTAGSIPEIIDDGVEGFLVPQRDPEALAAAIRRLHDDPAMAPRLGQAARKRFDKEFDIRATEPRLHERIRTAARSKRPTRA